MSTADTTLIGVKLQSVGENIATWGDPNLNNDLSVLARAAHGWVDVTITGDTTVSETSYSTSNETEVATIKLTGSPSAAFNYIIPARDRRLLIWNATGQTCTIKHSASTGFSFPTGTTVLAATDGAEVYNRSTNYIGTTFVPTNQGDVANVAYVDNAIANANTPASAGTVLVSGADTTANYLAAKLNTAGDLAVTVENSGGDENALITHTPYWNTPRSLAFADSPITALNRDIIRLNTSGGAITVNLPASGRVWVIDASGNAASNNITLTPSGADTITFGTIDSPYFGSPYVRTGTNWDLA